MTGRGRCARFVSGPGVGMRLVLVGPPGSGKGTQAERLVAHHGLRYIGTGDILRDAIRRANAARAEGRTVPQAGAPGPGRTGQRPGPRAVHRGQPADPVRGRRLPPDGRPGGLVRQAAGRPRDRARRGHPVRRERRGSRPPDLRPAGVAGRQGVSRRRTGPRKSPGCATWTPPRWSTGRTTGKRSSGSGSGCSTRRPTPCSPTTRPRRLLKVVPAVGTIDAIYAVMMNQLTPRA